jgi:hypothetical protein
MDSLLTKISKIKQVSHSRFDYVLHVTFALFLCLYSFLIIFSSKLLGFLFFIGGILFLGSVVWRGIKGILSFWFVITFLCFLFFSRIFWMDAFRVLPVNFYEIFQISFSLEFVIGIMLLYNLAVKTSPISKLVMNHLVHVSYFLAGVLLISYTWLYSYGAVLRGELTDLLWALLILVLFGTVYVLQLKTYGKRAWGAALYLLNISIGAWALYRWIHVFA